MTEHATTTITAADLNERGELFLLQAALHHYGLPGAVPLPKSHLDVLAKVKWPEIAG